MAYSKPTGKGQEKIERRQRTTCTDPKTVKELLGELYTDKEYLEKLLRETGQFVVVLKPRYRLR